MIGVLKRLAWRIADPALRKIGARMAHLRLLEQSIDRGSLDHIATLDATTTIANGAILDNKAPRENFVIGAFSFICGELLVMTPVGRLSVGHHCTIGPATRIWANASIEIGDYVMISHSVDIHDSDSHPLDAAERRRHCVSCCEHRAAFDPTHVLTRPVRIEDDVWIGFKASILKGVTIGRGAVVAAGAVVTRDVPPYALVAGNPARVVRMLNAVKESDSAAADEP